MTAERQDRVLLAFGGFPPPVALLDSGDLLPLIEKVFRGWDVRRIDRHELPAALRVSRCEQGYRLEGKWIPSSMFREEQTDALCGFVAELMSAYVNESPGPLCLHCAAAEFAGRLVIFPSTYRAGKSLLSACLAAAGVRLFADNILLVSDPEGDGIAPGLAPRLRLPLPEVLGAQVRSFIAARRGPSGSRYLYLDLSAEELAPHKARAPIGAIVLLDREEGAACELAPVGASDVLRQVIWQNFARRTEGPAILDRLHHIVAQVPLFRLRYGSAEEAAAFLKEAFQNWSGEPAEPSPSPDEPVAVETGTVQASGLADGFYLRNPAVVERMVAGDRFLVNPQDNAIHHLNPLAAALWNALSQPARAEDLIGLLLTAFPEAGPDDVVRDVEALLVQLVEAGLIMLSAGE